MKTFDPGCDFWATIALPKPWELVRAMRDGAVIVEAQLCCQDPEEILAPFETFLAELKRRLKKAENCPHDEGMTQEFETTGREYCTVCGKLMRGEVEK